MSLIKYYVTIIFEKATYKEFRIVMAFEFVGVFVDVHIEAFYSFEAVVMVHRHQPFDSR